MDVVMAKEDEKRSNHVSVGWGKKETQFQGRGAKALRDPTMPEKLDEGVRSSMDKGEATISWRGDGAYLAVNTIQEGCRRLIRVYSREGDLDSVNEPVDNLDGALSWRPAGNLMAGIQRFDDRIDVVFFERNGLRHGQFSLRVKPGDAEFDHPIELSWNSDSTVLAVILQNSVQLWTMGNYHWYLKQHILCPRENGRDALVWDSERPLRLAIQGQDYVKLLDYKFAVAKGTASPPYDFGAVAVIDGQNLKLTPMRSANVPPPMAKHEVELSSYAVDVAFNEDNTRFAVLYNNAFDLYQWDITAKESNMPSKLHTVPLEKDSTTENGTLTGLNIAFDQNTTVTVLATNNEVYEIQRYAEQDGSYAQDSFNINSIHRTLDTATINNVSVAFSQDASGRICVDTDSPHAPNASQDDVIPRPGFMPHTELALLGDRLVAFSMSSNGHLYANDRLLAKNSTSFLLTPAHLIFTTTTHMLKFIHLSNYTSISELSVPLDEPEKDERCRAVERGSKLITAMPTALSLVLQMPRGNLETIWPRAMVLAGIRKLVDEKNYKRAFAHCRTQRVDMNLLFDHAPEQFLDNVGLFINQVKKITYIDLFLSSLRDEDVTQSLYKDTSKPSPTPAPPVEVKGKINKICDAMLHILNSRQSTNLQNIVTAHLCKSPPALDDGLTLVASLMKTSESQADKAVEHICFLADVNKLYDHALGLYNLDLALLVAQQSQKDPREYLPFLQGLQEQPEIRRKFAIDDHLTRYPKALGHLHNAVTAEGGDEEEVDRYIVKHALYSDALVLYRYTPPRLNAITKLYAEYLEAKSDFHAAALAYESLTHFSSASRCYQLAGASYWRETLFCLQLSTPPASGEQISATAQSLAESLAETKNYYDAATLYSTYLSQPITAARLFCKGAFFSEAFSLATAPPHPHPSLLTQDGVLDQGLNEALGTTTELLSECRSQLSAQVPRILELRARALADPLAFYEGETSAAGQDIPDDISVASSRATTSASLFTRYTGRQSAGTAATGASRMTSKNRRREERKRARGKKGSVYEEEYLVASVGRLVERVESTRVEAERLVEGLVRRGLREGALAVEKLTAEVVDRCREAIVDVFGEEARPDPVEDENGYRPIGGDAVFAESMEARKQEIKMPVIGEFKKLGLLGV